MPPPDGYNALRIGAAWTVPPGRGWIAVGGADRATFLQGLLTNDVAALAPGGGCYAAYLTPQGRMIADMHLLAESDRIVADVHLDVKDRLLERWDDLIFTEDVRLADLTPETAAVDLYGPGGADVAAQVAGSADGGGSMALYEHRACRVASHDATVARLDHLGIEGYRLLIATSGADVLRGALIEVGTVEASAEACRTVRIETGRPAFPIDMDSGTIPLEAGITDRAIDFDKGCYVGQEVIVRILHRGQGRIARKLTGLTLEAGADAVAPPSGAAVTGEDGTVAGHVTSAAHSPALGRLIALAYLLRALADTPGARVTVAAPGGGQIPAAVTSLPFVPAV